MEEQVSRLVDKVWQGYQNMPKNQRFMVAIGGIPGSGKTNLSQRVTERLNERQQQEHPGSTPVAAFCPMDGYHWPRSVLDTFDPAMNAHARRGAEFTFDGQSFLSLVKLLRAPLDSEEGRKPIFAPSFDHAAKDPVDDDIEIRPHHRIVVFEGNYVCLDREPWRAAANLMDLRWFVQVERDVAKKRLAARHLASTIVDSLEAGVARAEENDLPNGDEINANKVPNIDETIVSKEDQGWAPVN
ncbi:hypothetical protein PFICI_05995 [Pestalotiopsis fici W106-1]|uniref:Phosphoribulokinase/uridine kinase domain-containing protein n=1 Tax=Pestalotiopsis fici (strain W106-1 / CGMCC3.15140) TaxID=1229662 RepID=W3X4C2_PESFW|nr:uncharacterized protein PFICI_05995 [Pestalotiopsis fici W106-1]ETS80993.1 hypothetical protein PFICI_05995 [Pestalotiopsis fici W106-1]